MGHTVQESGLGIVGILGFSQGFRQHQLLHLLLPDSLVYIPETRKNKAFLSEITLFHIHIGELVIAYLIPFIYPVISLIVPARFQFLHHCLKGQGLPQVRLILLIHPLPDISFQNHIIGKLFFRFPIQARGYIPHHLNNLSLIPSGIYRKNIYEITAKRIHNSKLLQQLLVGFLRCFQKLSAPPGPDHQRQDDSHSSHGRQPHRHQNLWVYLHKLQKSQILGRISRILRNQLVHHIIRHPCDALVQYGHKLSVTALPDIHPKVKACVVHNSIMQGIRKIVVDKKLRRVSIDKGSFSLSVQDSLQRGFPGWIIEQLCIPGKSLLNRRVILVLRNGYRSNFPVKILPCHFGYPGCQIGIRAKARSGCPFRHRFKIFLVNYHIYTIAVHKFIIPGSVPGYHSFIRQSGHFHDFRKIIRHNALQFPILHVGIRFPVPDCRSRNLLPARYHILDIVLLPLGKSIRIRIFRSIIFVKQHIHPVAFVHIHLTDGIIDLLNKPVVFFPHNCVKIVKLNNIQRFFISCFPKAGRQDCVNLTLLKSHRQFVRASVFDNPVCKFMFRRKFFQALLLASALYRTDYHAVVSLIITAVQFRVIRPHGQNGAAAPDGQGESKLFLPFLCLPA